MSNTFVPLIVNDTPLKVKYIPPSSPAVPSGLSSMLLPSSFPVSNALSPIF